MKTYLRKNCVLCDSQLQSFASFLHPMYDCTDGINSAWTIEYGYCTHCFSVQLMKLADPLVLYDKHYFQPLHQTHLWIQHNLSFLAFLVKNCPPQPILEIGSSSFCLGKHLIHYYKDYTVFDYSIEQAIQRPDVKYIEGNCEEYDFTQECIVMSHVFEHLYEPKKFIQNCCRNKVKTIVLSIPFMDDTQLHVSNQHTFLYNPQDIVYLCSLYDYKVKDFLHWNAADESFPCLFYYFTLDGPQQQQQLIEPRHLYTMKQFQYFSVPKNTFLTTSGMFTVLLYPWIQNKEDIIGIVDMDKKKQGKKFSYTLMIVQPYEALDKPGNTALVNHPKRKNIIAMIKQANVLEA
jgi:hypothetical protein